MKKNGLLVLSLSTVLVVAACGNNENEANNETENTNSTEENIDNNNEEVNNEAAPDTDAEENNETNNTDENNETENANEAGDNSLEDLEEETDPEEAMDFMEQDPEEPVAIVNGEEIPNEELQNQLAQFEAMFAQQDMDEEEGAMMMSQFQGQFLNQIISLRLLTQEADNRGIEEDDEAVQDEIDAIEENFETEEELQQVLESQGLTGEDLIDQARITVLLEEISDEYDVSEDELREEFEMMAMSDPEMADQEFEDVQEELTEQNIINQFITELEEEADIEILL